MAKSFEEARKARQSRVDKLYKRSVGAGQSKSKETRPVNKPPTKPARSDESPRNTPWTQKDVASSVKTKNFAEESKYKTIP